MNAAIEQAPWLLDILKLSGGGYLIWIGISIWLNAKRCVQSRACKACGFFPGWWRGFSSNITNPEELLFFGSLTILFIGGDAPSWIYVTVIAMIAGTECLWYALVILALSSGAAKRVYLPAKCGLDRAFGAAIIIFGARLLVPT